MIRKVILGKIAGFHPWHGDFLAMQSHLHRQELGQNFNEVLSGGRQEGKILRPSPVLFAPAPGASL
jgi:hypothetical protein